MKSVLIVNLARLGDLMQTIPMVMSIRRVYPDSSVALLVDKACESIGSIIPGIDDLYTFDRATLKSCLYNHPEGVVKAYAFLNEYFQMMRSCRFERVINITPHIIGVQAAQLSDQEHHPQHESDPWSTYYAAITRHWNMLPFHVSDLFAEIAGVPLYGRITGLAPSEQDHCSAQALLKHDACSKNVHYIGLHAGGSTREKRWPGSNYSTLCRLIVENMPDTVVVFVGTTDGSEPARVCAQRFPDQVLDCTGKTTPGVLAALLSRLSIVITGDSGPMHVAAAAGARIISLHTGKETCFTTGPYGAGHVCIEPQVSCHPCERPEACAAMQCRTGISASAVYTVLEWMCRRAETPSAGLPDSGNLHVYESAFDSDGYMDYFPAFERTLDFQSFSRRLLRTMWRIDLHRTRTGLQKDETARIDAAVRSAAGDVLKRFPLGCSAQIGATWQTVTSGCESLCAIARKGHAKALVMATTEKILSTKDLALLKEAAAVIENIDRAVIATGESLHLFAGITHMFVAEKQALEGKGLHEQARATCRIYANLMRRCGLVLRVGENIIQRINCRRTNKQGGTYEHYRQWHTGEHVNV